MASLIGKIINKRYRVEESLGRGGMAEVYRVFDQERGVTLAMKVLREDLAEDRVFLRRFQREAQNLAKLQHPNIVRFYGLEQEGALAFILMDYIEGLTLRRVIFDAGGPLPMQRVLAILQPVCSALNYAHRQGIVHCDLKSSNIMLDKSGRVYLTDFGIARMTDMATSTLVGTGTPAYMAPELILGKDPTAQSDIYALGVVLFEMLSGGERPFTGESADATGTTAEKVRWEQLHLEPPSIRTYNTSIPKNIDNVLACCLDKSPDKRFAKPVDLYDAIRLLLGDDLHQGINLKPDLEQGIEDQISEKVQKNASQEKDENVKKEFMFADTNERQNSSLPQKRALNEIESSSDEPPKNPGSNSKMVVSGGIILLMIIGISRCIIFQQEQELYTQQTQSAHATSTASYIATATESARREIQNEVDRIMADAVRIYIGSEDDHFILYENDHDNFLVCQEVGFDYRDFAIQADFTNPLDVSEGWDYGILFREEEGNDQLRLEISSPGDWDLLDRIDDQQKVINSGSSDNINNQAGSTNRIKLIAKGSKGYLFINDGFVSELDLSERLNSGSVKICTDLFSSTGVSGNYVNVDSVKMWQLP